ncbi:MAG TPA: site-specific integrase [Terriglobales bacterium]|nr:site-specific integrase [Terriglobales bacterium]
MSKIYKTAKKWNFFGGDNPALGVDLPPKKPVREKRILSQEQVPQLLAVLEEPARTMVLVGIRTGMRIGEILGLRREDIDRQGKQLHVAQAVYRGLIGTPKTKSSIRTLPLPDELLEALALHCRRFPAVNGCNLVFQTSKGTPFGDTNLLHRELKPAGRKIGAPWLSWHTLRRTLCTHFQEAGGSLIDAQRQLGHSRASTTLDIYTLPNSANQRNTIEKLSQLVTNGDESDQSAKAPRMLTQQIQ